MPEITYFIYGITLGLVAGISPGPLITLAISETIKHNKKAGLKIAFTPLITDIPIVILSLLFLSKIGEFRVILGIISFSGALFLLSLAWESFKKKYVATTKTEQTSTMQKGIIANFLSPHPYLFWITVGGPILFKSYGISLLTSILFILGFYIMLIGSKIIIVLLVAKSNNFINNNRYEIVLKILGILLIIFAIMFIKDGITYLKR